MALASICRINLAIFVVLLMLHMILNEEAIRKFKQQSHLAWIGQFPGGGGIARPTGNATLDCFNRFNIEKILSMYTTADYDSESKFRLYTLCTKCYQQIWA